MTNNAFEQTGGALVPANSNDVEVLEATPVDLEARIAEARDIFEQIRSGQLVLDGTKLRGVMRKLGELGGEVEKVSGKDKAKEILEGIWTSAGEVTGKAMEFGIDGALGRILRKKGSLTAFKSKVLVGVMILLGRELAKDLDITNLPIFMQPKKAA